MTKILVTGHEGFIGSYVFNHLRHDAGYGYLVDGMDFPDDVGDFQSEISMFEKPYDYVIHLAAFANIRGSLDNPEVFWENNVEKSKPIFDYCRRYNVRLLYASSAQVEEWWQNPYGITKKVNELQAPPNSVGMRFQTVYGENSRSDMLFRMLQDNTVKYITNHKRDWIHVKDVARAICYLMSSTFTGHIDVGTGEAIPVRELAEAFGQANLPVKENTPGERDVTCADTTALRELGWFPREKVLECIPDGKPNSNYR